MPGLGAVASKAILRESLVRLQKIRVACGKADDQGGKPRQLTGDEFTDRANHFLEKANEVKDKIVERQQSEITDEAEIVKEKAEIRRLLDLMAADLKVLEKLTQDAQDYYVKSEAKGKAAEKVITRKKHWEECKKTTDNCRMLLADTTKSNEVKPALGKKDKNGQRLKSRVRDHARDVLTRAERQHPELGKAKKGGGANAPYGGGDGAAVALPEGQQLVRLEDLPEYRAQMRSIQDNKKRINAGLDRVGEAVLRLKGLAINIGEDLDAQQKLIEETEERVAEQAKALKNTRKQVQTILKKQQPANVCINVFCFVLLLGIVGFFLFKFNVV